MVQDKLLLVSLLDVESDNRNKTVVDLFQNEDDPCFLKFEKKINGILLDDDLYKVLEYSYIDLVISSRSDVAILSQYGYLYAIDYAYVEHPFVNYLDFSTLRKLVKLEYEKKIMEV